MERELTGFFYLRYRQITALNHQTKTKKENKTMQNTTTYLPSDIKSKSLRNTYYTVQKIIADRYEKALKSTNDKSVKRELTKQFNDEIRDTIRYYVELC